MKKVLIVASVASMIDQFNMDNIRILNEIGCEIHVAANFDFGSTISQNRLKVFQQELKDMNVEIINVPFPRKIGSLKSNLEVYSILKTIIDDNNYCLIHAHSPIGGFLSRLASIKARRSGTLVMYTAHGFHFFKGAPILNWLIFYPIELILSKITDTIITINKEDYTIAQKFYAQNVVYIPSVGVDTFSFNSTFLNVNNKKSEIDIPTDGFVVLSVGELSKRKNHEVILKAISEIKNKSIYYLICGIGNQDTRLKQLINELDLGNRVKLLGFRTDVNEIIKIADCFAFPSKREGLGIAAIEAMASGLPIITSNVNGILDYSVDGLTGFVCDPDDIIGFANAIEKLFEDKVLRNKISKYNIEKSKDFDIRKVHDIMKMVYLDAVR